MVRSGLSVSIVTVLFMSFSGVGAPVLAASEIDISPTPDEIQSREQQDPKVCKRFKPIGSHITKKYCFRKSTWDAMREDGQQIMRAVNDRVSVNNSSGEGPN